MGPHWIVQLRVERLRIKAGTKTSISVAVSILSKSTSRFQAFCSSSIRKRRIRSSLCVAASFLARIHSRRRHLVTSVSATMFLTSLFFSTGTFFQNQIKKQSVTRVHLTCTPRQGLPSRRPPVVQVPSGSLGIVALATLTPPIGVFSVLALSFAALSIVGV